jgi:hypothetical protein
MLALGLVLMLAMTILMAALAFRGMVLLMQDLMHLMLGLTAL